MEARKLAAAKYLKKVWHPEKSAELKDKVNVVNS